MTRVKEMTNQLLNRKLTELIGYKVVKDQPSGTYRMMNPQGKQFGMSRPTEGLVWNDYAFPYCSDPAASLEVQAKAIEVDSVGYVRNLEIAKWKKIMAPLARKEVSVLLNASPRERAEAAYMTLQAYQVDKQ